MRVKQIMELVPLPSHIKLLWERLTTSRITTAYFLFSVCHCVIQVALQVRAFTINAEAASFLWNLAVDAGATNSSLIVADLNDDYLRLCPNVPSDLADPTVECQIVWSAMNKSSFNDATRNSSLSSSLEAASLLQELSSSSSSSTFTDTSIVALAPQSTERTTTTVFVTAVPTGVSEVEDDEEELEGDELFPRRSYNIKVLVANTNHTAKVSINGEEELLSGSCLWSLNWPVSVLDNTKREDIVFIAFQFWVLGMSIVALLNESIPHIFASLATHIMATAWSGYQILNTTVFRKTFNQVVTNGSCDGISLLPTYWDERAKAEYPTLALNIVALLVSAFLTWRLIKLFGWQTFKRVGASLAINRIYKLVLCLSIVLQLSFFFTGATVSLWIDNLINGVASQVVWYNAFYKGVSLTVAVLLIPWLAVGWVAIRRESRVMMFGFLFTSLLYLAGWSLMFLSTTFRWLFLGWHFFSVMASLSVFLTVASFVIGVVCRYNFGMGLLRYLNAQEPLPGDRFSPVHPGSDIEKVAFPSEKAVPTFSATFGSGNEVPPPKQMFAPRLGPRFFNRSAEPFETASTLVTVPPPALSRAPSDSSTSSFGKQVTVVRNNTKTSIGSFDSYYNYSSSNEGGHKRMQSEDSTMNGRRWIIE